MSGAVQEPGPMARVLRPIRGRLIAAALLSVERGARIVRVHDVRDTVMTLKVWQAMNDNAAWAG